MNRPGELLNNTSEKHVDGFLGLTNTAYKASDFKVSVVTYTQQVSEDWHYHEHDHISWIMKGGNLESRKMEDIQVIPGKILKYQQGEIHRNRFTSQSSKNLNIEFDDTFFNDELSFASLSRKTVPTLELLKIYFELNINDLLTNESIEYQVRSLFWNNEPINSKEWLRKLIRILNDRWNEFLSLDHLSKELDVHPVTISKFFSKHMGLTLAEYMRKIKVSRALDMLIQTKSSYAEIALQCGFSDQSHMNRLVKVYMGMTPAKIRSRV